MNIFARTLGGVFSDLFAKQGGLKGRVRWLFIALVCEGIALVTFSQMHVLSLAIGIMLVFSLFVQMAEGATFGVVPLSIKKPWAQWPVLSVQAVTWALYRQRFYSVAKASATSKASFTSLNRIGTCLLRTGRSL